MRKKILLIFTIAMLGMTACGNKLDNTENTTETEYKLETTEGDSLEEPVTESTSSGDEYIPTEEDMVIEDEATKAQEAEAIPAEEVQASTPEFTVEPMSNTTMYAQQTVNLRVGPGTNYEKIGKLTTNDEITVNGLANTASGSWYQLINADSTVKGYVSADYVKETKVKVTNNTTNSDKKQSNKKESTTNKSNSTTPSQSTTNNSTPSQSTTNNSTPSQNTSNDGETATGEPKGDGSGSSRENRGGYSDSGTIAGGNLQ